MLVSLGLARLKSKRLRGADRNVHSPASHELSLAFSSHFPFSSHKLRGDSLQPLAEFIRYAIE